MHSKGYAVHMVGMGGRFALFLLEVDKGVQHAIRDVQNQCQVGMWIRFVLPQRERKDARMAEKEAMNLN